MPTCEVLSRRRGGWPALMRVLVMTEAEFGQEFSGSDMRRYAVAASRSRASWEVMVGYSRLTVTGRVEAYFGAVKEAMRGDS